MTTPASVGPTSVYAVLGLGTMGHGIAGRALRSGLPTVVWDRTPERTRALEEMGAVVADSVEEAAQLSDIVVTMVSDIDAVLAIAIDRGMLDALSPGSTWLQMSTVGLAVDRVVDLVATRRPDVTLIDAPVSGSRQHAETGTLTIFASGPARDAGASRRSSTR